MVQYSHLYLILFACAFGLVISLDRPLSPRNVVGSFRAVGEMVFAIDGVLVQAYFEENFDRSHKKSVFVVISSIYNGTFVEDTGTGDTWRIDEEGCVKYDAFDWEQEHMPPDLKLYETKDGKPVFPIRQLINLKREHQQPSSTETVNIRDIVTWRYDYKVPVSETDESRYTLIRSYWSDGSMISPSKYSQIPVAFRLDFWRDEKQVKSQVINIHMFFEGEENQHAFEPVRGVFCPGLKEDTKLKERIQAMTTFSFSHELVRNDFPEISSIDAWMEPSKRLYRQDYTAINEFWLNYPIKLTRIASLNQGNGTVYEIRDRYGGEYGCTIKGMKDLPFDVQTIVVPQNAHDIEEFFGFKNTKFFIAGKVKERGIECQLYHGQRNDWPPPYRNITTLWEWCIANQDVQGDQTVKFDEEHFPLVSLNIYITKSPYKSVATSEFYEGMKYTHHFYNLHTYPNNLLETTVFDISPCFTDDQMDVLQFLVSSTDVTRRDTLQNDLNDVDFISMWKNAIYTASGLKPESLRISKPVLEFTSPSNMTVTFHIMDRHPNISESDEPIGLTQAISNLQNAVKNNNLGVKYAKAGQTFDLQVKVISKRKIDDPNKEADSVTDGYSGGTMAAVAIIMLVMGAAVGAAVFVLKKKYYDPRR